MVYLKYHTIYNILHNESIYTYNHTNPYFKYTLWSSNMASWKPQRIDKTSMIGDWTLPPFESGGYRYDMPTDRFKQK